MTQSPPEGMLPVTQEDRDLYRTLLTLADTNVIRRVNGEEIISGLELIAAHRHAVEARAKDAEDLLKRWVAWHKDGGDGDELVSLTLAALSSKAGQS